MIKLRNISKKFFMNKCGFVLLSTGICLSFTGCNDEVIQNTDELSSSQSSTCISDDIVTITDSHVNTTQVVKDDFFNNSSNITSFNSADVIMTESDATEVDVTEVDVVDVEVTESTFVETVPVESFTEEANYINNSFYKISNLYTHYEVQEEDTLSSIAFKAGISENDVLSINHVENISVGDVIFLPIYLVRYYIDNVKSVNEISMETGVSVDEICELNEVPIDFVFNKGYGVSVKKLFLSQDKYDTEIGVANIINNNIIFGDKVVPINNDYLVLKNNLYEYGLNDVYLYSFNDGSISCEKLFSNVKDIDLVNGIPVAYIRNYSDIDSLVYYAELYGYSVFYDNLITINYVNYSIYLDFNKDLLYTFDNVQYEFDNYNYSYDNAFSKVY